MINWFKGIDKFVPALLGMIIIAKIMPNVAVYDGGIILKTITDIGVTLIFLFYGIKLNPRKLKMDLANWKLHVLIQSATFILFPAIILLTRIIPIKEEYYLIWLGFFFLATLPSTVSSSVVMVSIAKGNVPGAIFNASISSLAGVFITPLWMSMVISSDAENNAEISTIILKLILQVLLPIILGLFLNRYIGHIAHKKAKYLKLFDQTIILLIVYISFAESFHNKLFENTGIAELMLIIALSLALYFMIFAIIKAVTRKQNFSRADTTTALFAGSKKSLVHGTVMSGIIFQGFSGIGIILLPLMIYHALQLVVTGIIAERRSKLSAE